MSPFLFCFYLANCNCHIQFQCESRLIQKAFDKGSLYEKSENQRRGQNYNIWYLYVPKKILGKIFADLAGVGVIDFWSRNQMSKLWLDSFLIILMTSGTSFIKNPFVSSSHTRKRGNGSLVYWKNREGRSASLKRPRFSSEMYFLFAPTLNLINNNKWAIKTSTWRTN